MSLTARVRATLAGAARGTALLAPQTRAQGGPNDHTISKAELVVMNGMIGGITAAVGAYRHDTSVPQAFLTGFGGGLAIGTAKLAVGYDAGLAWPARLVNALGTDIVTNTATGQPPLARLGIDLAPLHLELYSQERGFAITPRILPDAAIDLGGRMLHKGRLNVRKTLEYGVPIFDEKPSTTYDPSFTSQGGITLQSKNTLFAFSSSSTYCVAHAPKYTRCTATEQDILYEMPNILKHELVHDLQGSSADQLSTLLPDWLQAKRHAIEDKFHVDFSGGLDFLLSYAEFGLRHQDRPLEIEASSFSRSVWRSVGSRTCTQVYDVVGKRMHTVSDTCD